EYHLWEIPLISMDVTLKHYMRLSQQETMNNISEVLEKIRKFQGVFSLLWHNSSFDSRWYSWINHYEKIIQNLLSYDIYSNSGDNIIFKFIRKVR
ncbi:MAG: hypothetical protein ACOCRK_04625, partial [bacterium]